MSEIKGIIETSFIDWPGRSCAVLFLGGCNFRCPFCHNHPLVLKPHSLSTLGLSSVRLKLAPYKKWLGGICISGGEPTLAPQLPDMLQQLKDDDWPVKLDTNGSRPDILEHILENNLVDMVAMDIKAPLEPEKYKRSCGVEVNLDDIRQSIQLILKSNVQKEFRMTVLPALHNKDDILACADLIEDVPLKIQNFNPRTTLDPSFTSQKSYPPDDFNALQKLVA